MSIQELPLDVLGVVFSYFDFCTVLTVSSVSREWCHLADSDDVWHALTMKKGLTDHHQHDCNYKDLFKRMLFFKWKTEQAARNCGLTNNGRTVSKRNKSEWDAVKSDVGFISGKHNWSIVIEFDSDEGYCDPEDEILAMQPVVVGVVQNCVDFDNSNKGWAIALGSGKLIHDNTLSDPNDLKMFPIVSGDTINLELDFDGGTLSFSKNCGEMVVVFKGISGTIYPALSLFGNVSASLVYKY
ncbi:F-box/SPRY domain-containing protein [Acrasis kona]|uniref:F-box/SPRY domain-containing protein n=1 Tax=Acrasis kona TaxID=1008807 RepID=A0AAW2ZB10_9EUKA